MAASEHEEKLVPEGEMDNISPKEDHIDAPLDIESSEAEVLEADTHLENLASSEDENSSVNADKEESETTLAIEEQEANEEEAEPSEQVNTTPKAEPEITDNRQWYVIHCYSGYENKVRKNLEQRIETMNMKNKIFDVVIPTQEEIELRDGKRRTVERNVFPGYVLVNMILEEESWYVVRNTPGVTGFVGMGEEPTPLRSEEVSQILRRMEDEAPKYRVTFRPGERVRITDGPFNDFRGTVAEIDMERSKVRVMVNFFGRETPVELEFIQVEKA